MHSRVCGLMFRGEFGQLSAAQMAFQDAFPPASKDRSSFGSVSGGLWFSGRTGETNTHTHTPSLAGVDVGWKNSEFCLLNRGGCMHGWMGDRRNEWGAKSSTLTGLFILHAYTPIQDICDANSAQESKLCLLGSSLCVCVWV